MTVLDWSFSAPPTGELAGAGVSGAVRYLGGQASLSAGERDALRGAGLALGLVWEQGAARALQGFSAGAEDRRAAEGQASALGMDGCCLYLACDTDARGSSAVRNYFLGAASAADPAWRRGGYVGDDPGDAMLAEGTLELLWQPAASSWSWRYPSPSAALVQRVGQTLRLSGGSWDENDAQAPDWGQWPSAAAPAAREDDAMIVHDLEGGGYYMTGASGLAKLDDRLAFLLHAPSVGLAYAELPTTLDVVNLAQRLAPPAVSAAGAGAGPSAAQLAAINEAKAALAGSPAALQALSAAGL